MTSLGTINGIFGQSSSPSYVVPEGVENLPGFLGIDPSGVILVDCRSNIGISDDEVRTRVEPIVNAVIARLNDSQRACLGLVTHVGESYISVASHDLPPEREIELYSIGGDIGRRYDVNQLRDDERARFVLWASNADRESNAQLACARRSSAWGSGGREVTPPSQVECETVTPTELVEAMIWSFVQERRRQIIHAALHRTQNHRHVA